MIGKIKNETSLKTKWLLYICLSMVFIVEISTSLFEAGLIAFHTYTITIGLTVGAIMIIDYVINIGRILMTGVKGWGYDRKYKSKTSSSVVPTYVHDAPQLQTANEKAI